MVGNDSVIWEVYIIQTESGKLYTGITTNLERRFKEHQIQKKGAKFFHFSSPEKIVFRETYQDRSGASKKENFIKKMSRKEKMQLIEKTKAFSKSVDVLEKK